MGNNEMPWEADSLVAKRSENTDRYTRSFLRQVVCEFRFPTLMELGTDRPPASFVNALRKDYPSLELANELKLGIGVGSTGTSHSHLFRSPKVNWTVSLKEGAFSIETTTYTNFAQMKQRVLKVVEAASKIIDSDFFTRIGLRYINRIDRGEDPADGWINPDLVAPLCSGQFKGVSEYAGKLLLGAPDGGCLLQHGIRIKPKQVDDSVQAEYFLDIDSFRTEVEVVNTEAALDAIHSQAFDLFDWAIGKKSRDHLTSTEKSTKA